jgi:hypothetical protein
VNDIPVPADKLDKSPPKLTPEIVLEANLEIGIAPLATLSNVRFAFLVRESWMPIGAGFVFVIVILPLDVIGLPDMLIPVPAVAPILVTVPTLNTLFTLKSLVEPLIVIVLVLGTYPVRLVANRDFDTRPVALAVSAVNVLATLPLKLLPNKP